MKLFYNSLKLMIVIFFVVTAVVLPTGSPANPVVIPSVVKDPPIVEPNPTVSAKPASPPKSTPTSVPTLSQTSAPSLDSQLARHNNINDCWLKISGHFYDITSFFGSHPGGDQRMLAYCGKDATTAFNTKGQPGGSPHSVDAQSLLQQYLIK